MSDEIENDADDEFHRRCSTCGCRIGALATAGIAVILALTNPSDAVVRQRIIADGWVPVRVERTNLWLLSYTNIVGFTGAKATYVGIGGQVFGIERGR